MLFPRYGSNLYVFERLASTAGEEFESAIFGDLDNLYID